MALRSKSKRPINSDPEKLSVLTPLKDNIPLGSIAEEVSKLSFSTYVKVAPDSGVKTPVQSPKSTPPSFTIPAPPVVTN